MLHVQVFDSYSDITSAFLSMCDSIHETNASLQHIKTPSRCHVTTMTFVATLSKSLNLCKTKVNTFVTDFERHEDPYFTKIGRCAFSSTCVEFHSMIMPSVRIKVFTKGAVQMTGCKSHVEAMHALIEVCRVLSEYYDEPIEALTMTSALINVNVTLDTGIHLTRFANAARAKGLIAEQPERPPSCILKIPSSRATVLVYKPGKFVICGAATPSDVALSYKYVMQTLDDSKECVECRNDEAIRRCRGRYTWTQLVQCGMPGAMHTHMPTTMARAIDGCLYCARFNNYFYSTEHRT